MTSRSTSPERFNFSALGEAHPLPNLLEIQRDSFDLFMKQGLREAFEAISPITDFTGRLSLELEFDPDDADLKSPPSSPWKSAVSAPPRTPSPSSCAHVS